MNTLNQLNPWIAAAIVAAHVFAWPLVRKWLGGLRPAAHPLAGILVEMVEEAFTEATTTHDAHDVYVALANAIRTAETKQ